MRKLILFSLIFAVFLSPAAAQVEWPQPERPKLKVSWYGACVQIKWKKVRGFNNYEVRITKEGSGRIQYLADSEDDVRYGWQNWRTLRAAQRDKDTNRFSTHWCGLVGGQKVRARVRAIDKNGDIGPSSPASRTVVTEEFSLW